MFCRRTTLVAEVLAFLMLAMLLGLTCVKAADEPVAALDEVTVEEVSFRHQDHTLSGLCDALCSCSMATATRRPVRPGLWSRSSVVALRSLRMEMLQSGFSGMPITPSYDRDRPAA